MKTIVHKDYVKQNGKMIVVSVEIGAIKYDEGWGPSLKKVGYATPVINRRAVMDIIESAYHAWYDEMENTTADTVKVWVTGRPGRWIGNGRIPAIRLA